VALRTTAEDILRAADLASIEARRAVASTTTDPAAYVRSLDVRLAFCRSPHDQLGRIHELSTKTNQFNTGFLRLSEVEVAARLADPTTFVVTAALQDRLSDSGVVGLLVGRMAAGSPPIVEEVAISCRALGRGVEDAIVAEALRGVLSVAPPDRVTFAFRAGPRNGPAREWLERLSGRTVEEGEVEIPWVRLEEARQVVVPLVNIAWRDA
jgi:FkbH-like protein